jgi:hypothetical protein
MSLARDDAMPSVQCYFISALFFRTQQHLHAFIKEASEREREKNIEVIRLEKAKLRQRKFNMCVRIRKKSEKGICTLYFHACDAAGGDVR